MIVSQVSDPFLRAALARAARPDEDVVCTPALAGQALAHGFPRLVVLAAGEPATFERVEAEDGRCVPELTITRGMLQGWESTRRSDPVPRPRLAVAATCIRLAIRDHAGGPGWVDRTLADLSRAFGAPLPPALAGLGRRVMEFPSYYSDLHALTELTGLSRGALKARFRRRDLDSPSTWIRWFRVLAAAHLLANPECPTVEVAWRLGMTGSGNVCRLVQDVAGVTTTRLRAPGGREALFAGMVRELGFAFRREGWGTLEDLFLRDVG